jgi:hypothetical protein
MTAGLATLKNQSDPRPEGLKYPQKEPWRQTVIDPPRWW